MACTHAEAGISRQAAPDMHQTGDEPPLASLCGPYCWEAACCPCQVDRVSGLGPAGASGPSLGHCDPMLPSATPAPLDRTGLVPASGLHVTGLARAGMDPTLSSAGQEGMVVLGEATSQFTKVSRGMAGNNLPLQW